jgi:glycogen(starch) synthase
MKILIVSNLYPPYYMGAYELRCAQVAAALPAAGHEVRVLTSRYGLDPEQKRVLRDREVAGVRVQRVLGQYHHGPQDPIRRPYFLGTVKPQLQDVSHFVRVLDEFQPDVVNWWGISGLTKALLSVPRMKSIPDLFCIDDDWIIEEQSRGELGERPSWTAHWRTNDKPWYWHPFLVWVLERWKRNLLKKGIPTSPVRFCPTKACFVSNFLKTEYEAAGIVFPSVEVIYGGVSVSAFLFRREITGQSREPLRLLYVGQITRDRGLHTAIEALSSLSREARSLASLTVVGDSCDAKYLSEVRELVVVLGLSDRVIFTGKKPYDEMAQIYRLHDLFIAPSLRKEGLPFTMMEAMLSGCAVVTTGSGGAMEIARLGDLPLFPKGDAVALSRFLEEMIANRQALDLIAKRGQDVALREFSSDRMIKHFLNTFEELYEKKQRGNVRDNRILQDNTELQIVANR